MAAPVHIKVDTSEFSRAMREYMKYSKRDFGEVINQKGYSIAMAAARPFTKVATKSSVRKALSDKVMVGKIINAARGRKGEKGLYGKDMREAVKKFVQEHVDATNFLAAGWLSAVAVFARAIRRKPGVSALKFFAKFGYHKDGSPTGEGRAATIGTWFPQASLANMAFSRHTSTQNGVKFAEDGLRLAIAQEITRMAAHLAKKQQQIANRFSGRR